MTSRTLSIGASVLLLASGCPRKEEAHREESHEEHEKEREELITLKPAAVEAAGIKLGKVEHRALASGLKAPARITFTQTGVAKVAARVQGRLVSIDVQLGQKVKKGQIIQAKILSMDAENRKISLGVKQLTEDPWPRLTQSFQPGADLKGRITKIVNFGIFVALDNGLEGLVHVSEIPHDRAQMVESSFRVGESVHVRVLHIDDENRKIALSLKGARQDH